MKELQYDFRPTVMRPVDFTNQEFRAIVILLVIAVHEHIILSVQSDDGTVSDPRKTLISLHYNCTAALHHRSPILVIVRSSHLFGASDNYLISTFRAAATQIE